MGFLNNKVLLSAGPCSLPLLPDLSAMSSRPNGEGCPVRRGGLPRTGVRRLVRGVRVSIFIKKPKLLPGQPWPHILLFPLLHFKKSDSHIFILFILIKSCTIYLTYTLMPQTSVNVGLVLTTISRRRRTAYDARNRSTGGLAGILKVAYG